MACIKTNIGLILTFISFIGYVSGTNCKGCVLLDSYCFDKIISKFDAAIVKFDVAYPYGTKHEEFGKMSEGLRDVSQLLVGEVGVKDYGEKDNTDLAARFAVNKEDFPVVMLFKPGAAPITFSGDFNAEALVNFIRQNTEVYVGLPGCLEEFDKLAVKFSLASDDKEKKKILRLTEDLWDSMKGASNQKAAEVYVKTMRHSIEKQRFVEGELKRIENIIKGKISKEKATEMQLRINILKSFVHTKTPKNEL